MRVHRGLWYWPAWLRRLIRTAPSPLAPTDAHEAAAAVAREREQLDVARRRAGEVDELAEQLGQYCTRNHFAELLSGAFTARR